MGTFKNRLEQVRLHLRLSKQDFAKTLDISGSYLSHILSENGKGKFQFEHAIKLVEMGINVSWLANGKGSMLVSEGITGEPPALYAPKIVAEVIAYSRIPVPVSKGDLAYKILEDLVEKTVNRSPEIFGATYQAGIQILASSWLTVLELASEFRGPGNQIEYRGKQYVFSPR